MGAGCPTGGTSLALGGRGPQTRPRETKRHDDQRTTSGSPRGPDRPTGAEADDTLETDGPMTRARATRVSKARGLAATRRRTHAPIERLATDFADVYDRVLSEISSTARCILAASSPVLREAHASLRPAEPVGLYKLSDALTHVSTATWWIRSVPIKSTGDDNSPSAHKRRQKLTRVMSVVGPPTEVVDKVQQMSVTYDFEGYCTAYAPRYGHLHLLEYLQRKCWYFKLGHNEIWERDDECLVMACRAAESGHLNIVQWIFNYTSDGAFAEPISDNDPTFLFEVAWAGVRGGAMHVLEWLFGHLSGQDELIIEDSWMSATWSYRACRMLYYAFQEVDADGVLRGGHYLCAEAAKRGNLEMLKWLRAEVTYIEDPDGSLGPPRPRCVWNEWTCTAAAGSGHLDVLSWAFENGCPFDENVIRRARVIGRRDIEEWALANHLPEPDGDDDSWMESDEYSSDPSDAFLDESLSDSD